MLPLLREEAGGGRPWKAEEQIQQTPCRRRPRVSRLYLSTKASITSTFRRWRTSLVTDRYAPHTCGSVPLMRQDTVVCQTSLADF